MLTFRTAARLAGFLLPSCARRGACEQTGAGLGRSAVLRGPLGGVLFGLLLLSLASCKRTSPGEVPLLPTRVTRIEVVSAVDWASLGGAAVSDGALQRSAEQGLQQAGIAVQLGAAPDTPGDFVLELEVAVQRLSPRPGPGAKATAGGADPATAEPGVLLRAITAGQLRTKRRYSALEPPTREAGAAPRPELDRLSHVAVVEKSFAVPPVPTEAAAAQATTAVEATARTLGAELRLLGVPQAQLLKEVGAVHQDAAVRGVAMQLLGQRKVVAAVPALIDALKEPKGELRDQAIGALVAIGDRRAVRPLLNAVQFMDRVEMGKVLEAAAALGGEDARSYLVFVAQSHSDAGLRQEAKDALARLERKEAQAASAVSP